MFFYSKLFNKVHKIKTSLIIVCIWLYFFLSPMTMRIPQNQSVTNTMNKFCTCLKLLENQENWKCKVKLTINMEDIALAKWISGPPAFGMIDVYKFGILNYIHTKMNIWENLYTIGWCRFWNSFMNMHGHLPNMAPSLHYFFFFIKRMDYVFTLFLWS